MMHCAPFDLRDYFFEELAAPERRQVESHVAACSACREELERLSLTRQALGHLPDEEIPRRIAFVSDKVFEPSWLARRWAELGFAAAFALAMFFAGAWYSGRSTARVAETMAAIEVRHAGEMRDVEQAYQMVVKQMNEFYRRDAEARPALYRQ